MSGTVVDWLPLTLDDCLQRVFSVLVPSTMGSSVCSMRRSCLQMPQPVHHHPAAYKRQLLGNGRKAHLRPEWDQTNLFLIDHSDAGPVLAATEKDGTNHHVGNPHGAMQRTYEDAFTSERPYFNKTVYDESALPRLLSESAACSNMQGSQALPSCLTDRTWFAEYFYHHRYHRSCWDHSWHA